MSAEEIVKALFALCEEFNITPTEKLLFCFIDILKSVS